MTASWAGASVRSWGTSPYRDRMSSVELPLLPLRELIVFPHEVVPLFVGREKSINALEEAMAGCRRILLCAQKKEKENPANIKRRNNVYNNRMWRSESRSLNF